MLSDYFHHLRTWKRQYAPQQPEDEWHPLFVEALQRESHIEYLLDVPLYGTAEREPFVQSGVWGEFPQQAKGDFRMPEISMFVKFV